MATATIRLQDLELAVFAANMRQRNHGKTAQFAALSEHPTIQLDCHRRNVYQSHIDEAKRHGQSTARCGPMTRGHIANLIERTRWRHSLPEIRKTWGTGIRALLNEPKYILHGGHP